MNQSEQINTLIYKLNSIFRDVFDDDNLQISTTTEAADVAGWDSLAHIRLIVSIERALNVRFTADEISVLENVGDLIKLIIIKVPNIGK